MKLKFSALLLAVFFILFSCISQTYMDQQSLNKVLADKEFTFMAKHANPTNYDVINVMNSLPNSTSNRMLELDYGYGYTIKNNVLEVTLPYFGRTYIPSMDPEKASYRFTSKDFEMNEIDGRKGSRIFIIVPHDVQYVRRIITEVYTNGKAYVSIDSNDRQPISYDGYLSKNDIKK